MVNYLSEPVERNYMVWPVIDKPLFWTPNYISQSYEEEIWNIKNWLTGRLEWIDSNVDNIYYEVVIYSNIDETAVEFKFNYAVYPNPFNEELIIDYSSARAGSVQFELWDVMGKLQYTSFQNIEPGSAQIILNDIQLKIIPPGIYMIRIALNGNIVSTQRIIKQ